MKTITRTHNKIVEPLWSGLVKAKVLGAEEPLGIDSS